MKKILFVLAMVLVTFLASCDPVETEKCEAGTHEEMGECVPDEPICEDDEMIENGICVDIPLECEDGYEEVDGSCEPVLLEGQVLVPSFIGLDYGDVLTWGFENSILITSQSTYRDDIEPNEVYDQTTQVGSVLNKWDSLEVFYSRGFDPEEVMVIPDFTGQSREEITAWLRDNHMGNYEFRDRFSDTPVGTYLGYDVKHLEQDGNENLRKDKYSFYLSYGPVEIEEVVFNSEAVRGVNLGGWFVLESWMTPGLFAGLNAADETEYMQQKENALEAIEEHWDTFITEDDFIWLSDHGVEYVRLPIPWWYRGGLAYEGTELEVVYGDSRFYIHRAMQWAEDYGIKVMLDLHTAPGGQNGFDNGGLAGHLEWPNKEEYINTTISSLVNITNDFKSYDSFWGLELLNEPGWSVDIHLLQEFYVDAYNAIRMFDQDVWIGMHDGFKMYMEYEWNKFFTDNDFTNVFFDIHLYQVFGDGWGEFDIVDHLRWVEVEQDKAVQRYKNVVPTIVGEWSIGLQGNVYDGLDGDSIRDLKIAFANKQINVYEQGMGWFFWSYKLDTDSHFEWSFKRLVEAEVFPTYFTVE